MSLFLQNMYINYKNEENKKLILIEYDAGYVSPKEFGNQKC